MKKVNLIIIVPSGEYCWNGHDEVCEHFSNEGGHSVCDLDFRIKDKTNKKPVDCFNLKEILCP
jgi:hypothetical protein